MDDNTVDKWGRYALLSAILCVPVSFAAMYAVFAATAGVSPGWIGNGGVPAPALVWVAALLPSVLCGCIGIAAFALGIRRKRKPTTIKGAVAVLVGMVAFHFFGFAVAMANIA